MSNEKFIEKILIIVIFLVLIFVIVFTPTVNKYKNNGELIINEVMPQNKYTLKSKSGEYFDYIEIYNGYDYDINMSGYYLSDDNFSTKKWAFPAVIIKSHEYLVVYASGLNKYEDDELHTNFKLSSDGEVVTLSNSDGKSISRIYYMPTLSDTSYGYNGSKYVYFYEGTPGYENNSLFSDKAISLEDSNANIKITEYMTNNISSYRSHDNKYYSMIELYNDSDNDIDISNYYLSNSSKYINKYKFPNITIRSHEYLVVYASGLDKYEDNELHTNFILNANDNVLVLTDSKKNIIDKVYLSKLEGNVSCGLYNSEFHYYTIPSFGSDNDNNYMDKVVVNKDIIINEVIAVTNDSIELYNVTDKDINLSNYSISDKSGKIAKLPNAIIKGHGYYVIYGSDNYSYNNGKLYTGFKINNSNEIIYLYKDNILIDTYSVGKLRSDMSSGINDEGKHVFYKNTTMGGKNSSTYYSGYAKEPIFSLNGGYIEKDTVITLKTLDDSEIYYTLDGSMPNKGSIKYNDGIKVNKTMVIKAIAISDNKIESDIVSRTFFVGRHHDLSVVSISTNSDNLFSNQSGILVNGYYNNYRRDWERQINFEIYESDGSLGISFMGGIKLVGQDSRNQPQKSMAIYLRERYGLSEITYPFFENGDANTFKSFVLRNSGEDPNRIRIKDTFLSYALKGQMDIDMQDYRAVVVYINGVYYGLYNLREKVNENYLVSNYGIEKGSVDLIKGINTVQAGSIDQYNNLVNYIRSHDTRNDDVYAYLETQIDMQELCNYWVVQTYYANTDTGNIRFWKPKNGGKWRWILFDQDWSMYPSTYQSTDIFYPFLPYGHGTGNYFPTTITYRLWQNSKFRDLYLTTLAYHMKNTFKPSRMQSILEKLKKEVENEMPYHIERWYNEYRNSGDGAISSMDSWYNNVNKLSSMLENRYNIVLRNIKSKFSLSDSEYQKYFGDI